MDASALANRLQEIMTQDDMQRINIGVNDPGFLIQVDLHGLTCAEAKRFLNNIICLVNPGFRFDVIHGYNHGTALKNMLMEDFNNKRVIKKNPDHKNPGLTHILISQGRRLQYA